MVSGHIGVDLLEALDRFYLAAVCAAVPGLGRVSVPGLVQHFGSARSLFAATAEELLATHLCSEKQAYNFVEHRKEDLPLRLEEFCRRSGVRIVTIFDMEYPASLRQISDPPIVLYVKGQLPSNGYHVAVVGSREATPYGIKAAQYFAGELARRGLVIISGGARGIDTAAHQAALDAGGITVAVLGCGININYPAENKRLFNDIVDAGGAVISEYPPGVAPMAMNFPARNRIIVGLSRAVLVAEAARKSGAIITANIAADEGRDVYCVPGNIFNGTSIGCHDLIRTGAKLVDGAEDILEDRQLWKRGAGREAVQQTIFEMNNSFAPALKPARYRGATASPSKADKTNSTAKSAKLAAGKKTKALEIDKLSETGRQLAALLESEPLTLEELLEKSGLQFTQVSMELLDMQVAGVVSQDVRQRYYLM